jgi:Ribbon-helix-helix protein, copG family
MDKININKQNNHNARSANRRGRRTKINFRARAGQRARTVSPLAKTPAVQILTISNVPSDIVEAIDELAARQDRTRSSFVRHELQRIVAEYQAKEALSKSR